MNTVQRIDLPGRSSFFVLHRVRILEYFCPTQGQDFKPSAAHLYPNVCQVPRLPTEMRGSDGCKVDVRLVLSDYEDDGSVLYLLGDEFMVKVKAKNDHRS